jgi:integrase
MFAVLGMAGCRVGEMLGLKIGDLDFNRKVIYIRRSIDSRTKQEQSTKTKGSTAEVPMPVALEKRIRAFLEDRIPRKSEPLFIRQPKRQPLFGWKGNRVRALASARQAGHYSHRHSRSPPRGSK